MLRKQFANDISLLLLAGALSSAVVAAQPTVTKVEPPSWWAGHSINPVRLLVRGTNLKGASVGRPEDFAPAMSK